MRLTTAVSVVITLASGAISATRAQPTPPDPSPELQRQDRQRQELRQRIEVLPWQPAFRATRTPVEQQLPNEHPCVLIHRVTIQGALFSKAIQAAIDGVQGDDPPQGRCLGGQAITLLIQRAQQALIEQGYITSHVHVPEQDLGTGQLILQIREGRAARISRSRPKSDGITDDVADGFLPRLVWAVREGGILNLRDIEQSADNLQRLPSLNAKIQIEPGEAPGTSDLAVDLNAGRPLRLSLSVDDGGLKSTGKLQGAATLSWDNPLGLGDLFYLTTGQDVGDRDAGPRGSRNQIIHYSVPWGYWMFGATFSKNRYRQTVFGPFESYLYSGISSQQEWSLGHVLHRTATSKTTANVKGFERHSNNFISDLEVLVQRRRATGWEASLQHLHYFEAGTLTALLSRRHGHAKVGAPESEGGTGQVASLIRLSSGLLHWEMPLSSTGHTWQYRTQLQWQRAQAPSTPQDQFCLGSRATVRGFDGQQTLCGHRGQLWRQELSTGLPTADGQTFAISNAIQVYGAFDTGRTRSAGNERAYRLSGMAWGLRGLHKVNGTYPLQWDVFWGTPLSRPTGFISARHAAGFAIRTDF